jgi:hypothetical protein
MATPEYWVEQGGEHWAAADEYVPDAPPHVPHKGFAVLCVSTNGVVLRFSSKAQLEECIRVLAMKPLPTSKRLSALRGTNAGPNQHWLSRLPAAVKSPRVRARVVEALRRVHMVTAAPNPSIEQTSYSKLRLLPAAAHVKR